MTQFSNIYIDGVVQDCRVSSVLAVLHLAIFMPYKKE